MHYSTAALQKCNGTGNTSVGFCLKTESQNLPLSWKRLLGQPGNKTLYQLQYDDKHVGPPYCQAKMYTGHLHAAPVKSWSV